MDFLRTLTIGLAGAGRPYADHFGKYRQRGFDAIGGMDAPVCVAKGVDALALKIREVAGKHSVPIVENPPLARALHATVEVDQQIPPEHYKAVAEVIGYVMRLRRAMSLRR